MPQAVARLLSKQAEIFTSSEVFQKISAVAGFVSGLKRSAHLRRGVFLCPFAGKIAVRWMCDRPVSDTFRMIRGENA